METKAEEEVAVTPLAWPAFSPAKSEPDAEDAGRSRGGLRGAKAGG